MTTSIEQSYELARARYADLGVDTEKALQALKKVAISLHCWQGDDVSGFENPDAGLSGGIQSTGNYPSRARNAQELRADLDVTLRLIPGTHRLNLHSIYAETGKKRVSRNELEPVHFKNWIAWAKDRQMGLDFNGSFFSHPMAADGFTLSHRDRDVRKFWIEHGRACRAIGAEFGKALGTPCVTNVWIPDGFKDLPADRAAPRQRLMESLDAVFAKKLNPKYNLDAVESKLFGIGCESYVVGSHEFYMGYALSRGKLLCLDSGHFHPTEGIADKISSILTHMDEILLHVSRGVRWDSDHVVTLTDELNAIAEEVVRGHYLQRVHIGLDYFDASINRVAAWVIGSRNMLKALLKALLEPTASLQNMEANGDFAGRLAVLEDAKLLPLGAVWEHYCVQHDVPGDFAWLDQVREYEAKVLSKRK